MIARFWSCTALPENAPHYVEHFEASVMHELRALNGFLDAYVMRHETSGIVEITVVTLWESVTAIRAFAGVDIESAVVAPSVQAVLLSFDSRVTHREVAFHAVGGLSASVPATAARFSTRVPYYHTYRPRYPKNVLDVLAKYGLAAGSVVADIGAGTGISSELLLDGGCTVYAVEPNAEMRAASEHFYGDNDRFHAVNGTAEATGLPDAAVDWVTAGQAFHWFDHANAKPEFARILRPGGHVALFWNDRAENLSPFVDEYNDLMRRYDIEKGSTPRAQNLITDETQIAAFFAPDVADKFELPNPIEYDFDTLVGRAVSSSYAPLPGHERHAEMVDALRDVFDRHAVDGRVRMDYMTQIYVGKFT